MGRALQEPHDWLAHLPEDEELALTEAAAQLLGRQALRPVGDGRFYGPDLAISGDSGQAETGQPDEPALVGRDELLRELEDIARSCDLERVPAFVTTVGAAGLGKTRLLRELERRLSSGFLHRVHYLRGSDDQDLLTRLTCAALALEPESMTLDAVRDAVSDLCGDPQSDTEWVCLALSSGLLDPSEPRAGRLLRAPGAFRATTARVLAIGLRQQARTRATAILVDDLHRCQPAVLDALEIAAMEGESRIFVCGSARPDLLQTRPAWGDRPARDFRKTLPALTTSESAQLLSELLRPADYVAHDLVEQLREATAGIPGHLVDVAHAIRAGGGIRRLPGTRAYEVVVDEELINPSTPLAQRLAARQVASLAPELHRFVELCAVWGAPLVALELSEFQNTLPEGDPGAALDAWVGLQRLQRLQLVAKHDAPGFRSAELERGILAALSPARRRDLHRHALAWLQHRASGTADDARRIARHATYLGERDLAADAWLQLAGEAATLHHYDRAERYFGAALDGCRDHDNERRRLALQGRGRMRYRLWRLSEARADLERAAELTAEGPDSSSAAPLLFEQAIILDWSYDFAAAAAMTERAVAAAADSEDPLLGVHSKFARARTLYRSEQLSDAIPLLRESAEAARALGDYELRTIALLVLGMGLVYTKRHDEAEEAFAAVIESCEAAGDRFHCAAALVNRMNLWMGMGNYENAVADSRRAVEIARELGNAQIERGATYNLAELLGWSGSLDEAIAMATRCRELQLKYCEATEPEISILCARLHSIRGEHDEAQRLLDWISEHCASHPVPPSQQLLIDMVRLRSASERNEHAWSELLRQAEEKSISDERFEILYGCADHALRCRKHEQARRTLERARGMQELAPQWRARFSELEAALGR